MKNQAYPDYSRSLLSVTASISRCFGLPTSRAGLPELDALLAKKPRNVVLLVFDGLGDRLLTRNAQRMPFLSEHRAASISAVFPPTTTASTTSLETGLAPIEHGWLGWSLYFEELDKNVNLYPNTSGGEPAADFHVARRFMPFRTIVDRLNELGIDSAAISPYTEHTAPTIPELIDQTLEFCRGDGRHYVYGYSPLPDYDMHDLGTSHKKVVAEFSLIDSEVKRLCEGLDDALVLVSADHGMIDTTWRFMSEHPELCELLLRPPSLEARAMSLFVKPGKQREFALLFERYYGDIYELLPREAVLERGIFGNGEPHARSLGYIGDFLAIAHTGVSIGYEYDRHPFAAVHAGLTDDERFVPLCAILTDKK